MSERRTRSLKQFGTPASSPEGYIARQYLGGVVYPGTLNWECYPLDSTPETVTSGAANTDGTASSLIGANVISSPFYLTHLAVDFDTGGLATRWTVQEGTTTRRILRAYSRADTPGVPYILAVSPIYQMNARSEVNLITADPTGGLSYSVYAHVLVGPVYTVPWLQDTRPMLPQTVQLGTTNAVEVLSPTTLATPGTWGEYVTLLPAQPTASLVFGLNITTKQAQAVRIGLATDSTDWGHFGIPRTSVASNQYNVFLDLRPFPLYLPANTEITMRAQYVDGIATPPSRAIVGLSYVVLP